MKGLTDKQRHVLTFIKNYIAEKGYPPAMQDIGDGMGFSRKAASDYLQVLQKKGYIITAANKSRTIRIPKIYALEITEDVNVAAVAALQIGDYLNIREQTDGTPGDIVLTSHKIVKYFETGDAVHGKVVGFFREVE